MALDHAAYPQAARGRKYAVEAREVGVRRRDQGHELFEQLDPGHDEPPTAIGARRASCRTRSDHRATRSSATTPRLRGVWAQKSTIDDVKAALAVERADPQWARKQ
jgi:hypothetical protein